MISKKEKTKKEKIKYTEYQLSMFNDALQKMSTVSMQYQQGKIKHIAFADQMDALIAASGWSREDFHNEVERRSKKLSGR